MKKTYMMLENEDWGINENKNDYLYFDEILSKNSK